MFDSLFVILVGSAIGSVIVAWWQFARIKPGLASRQEVNTFIGLLAFSVEIVFPFFYAFSMPLQSALPWKYVLIGSWTISALTVVVGSFGLKQIRFPLIFGAFSVAALLVMVPIGVL
jgi:hypothetical protein